MSNGFRIVFFGSPDFAVPALRALSAGRHRVILVVTQPDRPSGRGRKPTPPPVKKAALELNLEIFQPENVNGDESFEKLAALSPDLFVTAAFGQLFSERLLKVPSKGPINIHASLLPKYRGPAPIHRAIVDGETETGATTMYMVKKLDAGDILLRSKTPIGPEDTAETLHDRLAGIGAELLTKTLDELEAGRLSPVAQDHSKATYAPMLSKNEGRIDWSLSSERIERFVRGMCPWPGAFTFWGGKRLKIFKAAPAAGEPGASPGLVLKGFENELRVATGDGGALGILEIQGASGKRMKIRDFLLGNRIPPGAILS
jgi:methionyl-tRNA formyltransferase